MSNFQDTEAMFWARVVAGTMTRIAAFCVGGLPVTLIGAVILSSPQWLLLSFVQVGIFFVSFAVFSFTRRIDPMIGITR